MIKHRFKSLILDDPASAASGEVLPSHWNDEHEVISFEYQLSGFTFEIDVTEFKQPFRTLKVQVLNTQGDDVSVYYRVSEGKIVFESNIDLTGYLAIIY